MQNRYCSRADRLGELIHKELAGIVLKYCQDPRLDHLTITNVKLTKDLSLAKVYFTNKLIVSNKVPTKAANKISSKSNNRLNQDVMIDIKQVLNILNRANSFLRCRLAEAVSLRKIPELKFFYDGNLEYSLKMESLLSNL